MSEPQELRAAHTARIVSPKRRTRDQWKAILADAVERGLCGADVAAEQNVTRMAVSLQTRALGVTLAEGRKGRAFVSTYQPKFQCPEQWGLTRQQAMLVAALVDANGVVLTRDLFAAITGENTDRKLVAVVTCKARKRLESFGVRIETIVGVGLAIAEADRIRLREGAVYLEQTLERAA